MASHTMNPDALATHLTIAAMHYTTQAATIRSLDAVTEMLLDRMEEMRRAAKECQIFAAALKDIRSIGYSGDDIEIETSKE